MNSRILKTYSLFLAIIALFVIAPRITHAQEWVFLDTLLVPRTDMCSAVMGDTLYIIGGTIPVGESTVTSPEVLRYDLTNLEWLPPAPQLNTARFGAAAVSFMGNLLVFGGSGSEDSYYGSVELWNPTLSSWLEIGELDIPRAGLRASVIEDHIYLSGGISSPLDRHSRISVISLFEQDTTFSINIDIAADTLPTPRSYHTMEAVHQRLYVFGGYYYWPLNDAYMHNSSGWTTLEPMPTALAGMGTTVFYVVDQPLIVLSGGRDETSESSNIRYFHANNMEWSDDFPLIDDLPVARSGHIMEAYEDGIFVAGGSYRNTVGERVLLNDLIVYFHQSTHNQFGPTEPLPQTLKVAASPNPSNGEITIRLESTSREALDITLYNVLGQPVADWNVSARDNKHTLSWSGKNISGNDVSAGIYFLVVKQGNHHQTKKLIRLP